MRKTVLLGGVFFILSAITTAGVLADPYGSGQSEKPKTTQEKTDKPKAAAAKPHTMTGCLEKGTDENTFRLTSVEGTGPKTVELHATAKQNLAAHVGHKVAITGPEVDPKTMKKGTTGKTGTPPPAAETTGTTGEHHMRVNSLKMVSTTCPS